jgi:hypothetical protein
MGRPILIQTHAPLPRKPIRWRVTLRGELLGHVYADNWPAACERAARRWKISKQEQAELRLEKAE